MKKLIACCFAMLPLAAMAYPIDVTDDVAGTDVTFDVQEINFNMSGVLVRNHGNVPVRCQATFRNGPEAPRTRKVLIKPHSESHLTAKFTREIMRLRVDLKCTNDA